MHERDAEAGRRARGERAIVMRPWVVPALLACVCIAIAFALSLVIIPVIVGCACWRTPGDSWIPLYPAQYVANGAYPFLYEADVHWIAGPVLPLVLAPVAWVGQTIHATSGWRFHVRYPSLWLIYAPYGLLLAVPLFEGSRRLVAGTLTPRAVWGSLVAATLLCGIPVAVIYGHHEDMLALGLIALAVAGVSDDRPWTWVLMGVAVATKQWTILAVPFVFFMVPEADRRRWLVRTSLIPLILLGVPILADPGHAISALFAGRAFPEAGRRAVWLSDAAPVVATPYRIVPVLVASAIAWGLRRRMSVEALAGGLGIAFLLRLVFEPAVFGYYLGPPLLLLALHESVSMRRAPVRTTAIGIPMLASFWVMPFGTSAWWLVQLALGAILAAPVIAGFARGDRERSELAPIGEPDRDDGRSWRAASRRGLVGGRG